MTRHVKQTNRFFNSDFFFTCVRLEDVWWRGLPQHPVKSSCAFEQNEVRGGRFRFQISIQFVSFMLWAIVIASVFWVKLKSYQFSSAGVGLYAKNLLSLLTGSAIMDGDQNIWDLTRVSDVWRFGEFTINRLYRWLSDLNQTIMPNSIIVGLWSCLLLTSCLSVQMLKLESVWLWRSVVFAWRHSCLGILRSARGVVELFTRISDANRNGTTEDAPNNLAVERQGICHSSFLTHFYQLRSEAFDANRRSCLRRT